jgi:hypothetical protein
MVETERAGRQKISWEERHSGGLARGLEVHIRRAELAVVVVVMPQEGLGMC